MRDRASTGLIGSWQRQLARAGGVVVLGPAIVLGALLITLGAVGIGGFGSVGELFSGPSIPAESQAAVTALPPPKAVVLPAVVLPARAAARPSVSSSTQPAPAGTTVGPAPVAGSPAGPSPSPQPAPAPSPAAPPGSGPPSSPPVGAPPPSPPPGGSPPGLTGTVGSIVTNAGAAAGGTVQTLTGAVGGAVSGLNSQLGSVVTTTGSSLGSTVTGVTGALGQTVSGLGGR